MRPGRVVGVGGGATQEEERRVFMAAAAGEAEGREEGWVERAIYLRRTRGVVQ